MFFGADKAKIVNEADGALVKLGHDPKLLEREGRRCGSLISRCLKKPATVA